MKEKLRGSYCHHTTYFSASRHLCVVVFFALAWPLNLAENKTSFMAPPNASFKDAMQLINPFERDLEGVFSFQSASASEEKKVIQCFSTQELEFSALVDHSPLNSEDIAQNVCFFLFCLCPSEHASLSYR